VTRRILTAVSAALLTAGFALLPAGAAGAAVSSSPPLTPQLATSGTDGTIEVVRQITQCGGTMYAVGLFTAVLNPSSATPIARNNADAFSATAPYRVTNWDPNVNGQVDTVECAPDGDILLGGSFTTVGGTAVRNLAKVDAATGANNAAFTFHPAGRVAHVEVVTDAGGVPHLLAGRYAAPYLSSVNPITGANDRYGLPAIAGIYDYPQATPQTPRVYNMTVSPDGRAVLMTGIFTSVGGQHHEQVFRLNLTAGSATVSAWAPTELYQHCFHRQPFYAQDAAWSPTMDRVYVVTTGYRLESEILLPSRQRPQVRSGPCDAALAYPTAEVEFDGHAWVNSTRCDSLYTVAADATTVFIGGHQRYIDNGQACDRLGPAPARAQSGLGELTPTTGLGQAGPNRGRGLGAADMLRTDTGLWIASDNQANTDLCAGRHGHKGICFLPN
jgi:hypothetical protein